MSCCIPKLDQTHIKESSNKSLPLTKMNTTKNKRLTAKNFNKNKIEENIELNRNSSKKTEIQFEKKNFWWYIIFIIIKLGVRFYVWEPNASMRIGLIIKRQPFVD